MKQFPCQCCGYLTRTSKDHAEDEICSICYWHDDPVYCDFPDEPIGPNEHSLYDAQKNFREFGACEKRLKRWARPPTEGEELAKAKYLGSLS